MTKTGQCHCGAVSFEVSSDPVRMAQCHCEACRRVTGTGHIVQAFFRKEDIKISGETTVHKSLSDAGTTRKRHFCPICGSRLFAENSKTPGAMGIAVGAFDESEWFKPDVILYNSQRPGWDKVDDTIEKHELM